MKTRKLFIAPLAALLLSGCDVKDPIYETAHPDHGKITLTTDWSATDAAASVPAHTVTVGEYSATVSGVTNTIDNLFAPGAYHAHIHNTASQITVSGHTAAVTSASAPSGGSGAFIDHMPGWFYTSSLDVAIEKDTDHEFTAVMRQQVVEMTFTVTPSGGTGDRIVSITGTLGGVAGAMNLDDNARTAPSSIVLNFTKQSDGKWKATVRLLGIVGDEQLLTTVVKFTDGNPGDVTDVTDIHDAIEDNFGPGGGPTGGGSGGGTTTPGIDLGTDIVETPTGAGFTATIGGWRNTTEEIEVTDGQDGKRP